MKALINKAKEIAEQAHAGQTDKAGKPYIEHLAFVVSMMNTDEEIIVAWLHDVMEDTCISAEYLSAIFSLRIMTALKDLTHADNESYDEYIKRMSLNPLAVNVKKADLIHNMDISRLSVPVEDDFQRVKKYKTAYDELTK